MVITRSSSECKCNCVEAVQRLGSVGCLPSAAGLRRSGRNPQHCRTQWAGHADTRPRRDPTQHSVLGSARYIYCDYVQTAINKLRSFEVKVIPGVFYIYTYSLMCQSFKLWFLHGKSKVQIDCSTCLSTFWNNCVSQSQCSDISVRKKIQFHCVTLCFETRGRM